MNIALLMERRHALLKREINAIWNHKPGFLSFPMFESFYGEPHRAYHNFEHLNQMYEVYNSCSDVVSLDAEAMANIELFIWWHDVIYQPRRKDNEYLSAQLFASCTKGIHTPVYDAILCSVHSGQAHNSKDWVKHCLDLDLSAMMQPKAFKRNGVKIEEEFRHLPLFTFLQGRKAFFKKLLSYEQIYYNPFGLKLFEDGEWMARTNIENEIIRLEKMGI